MTQCTQSSFDFKAHYSREVVARFDGGTISSDGGSLLLRADRSAAEPAGAILTNVFWTAGSRSAWNTPFWRWLSQRVYGLALGYEDLNDHEQLRKDPLFGVLAGREELDRPLAGKSTLNRLELGQWPARSVQEDHVLEAGSRRIAGQRVPRVAGNRRRSKSFWM